MPSGSILDKIIVLSFFNFIRIFAPDKAESTSAESLWPLVGACLAWVWAPLMWAKEVAEIAQSVEHFTRNEKVSGSSPDFGSRWTAQNFKPLRPFDGWCERRLCRPGKHNNVPKKGMRLGEQTDICAG